MEVGASIAFLDLQKSVRSRVIFPNDENDDESKNLGVSLSYKF